MSKKLASIIEISIIYLIFVIVIFKTYSKHKIENIKKNWNKHKNNILLSPIAEFLGKNSSNMFTGIIGQITNNIFAKTKTYFYYIFSLFNKIFGQYSNTINQIRNLTMPMRLFFKNATLMFYKNLSKGMIGVTYSMNKIKNTMNRSVSGFHMVFQTLMTMNISLQSIMNSPLVPIAKEFLPILDWIGTSFNIIDNNPSSMCFSGKTPINTYNGLINIEDLTFSDILQDNNKIITIHKFINNNDMYNYKNIIVSGSHLVYENNKWIRVKYSNISYKVDYNEPYIYCLTTTSKIINIYDINFSDFSESNDKLINYEVNNIILKKLNNNKNIINNTYINSLEQGIDKNINIKINNKWNKIKNIKIGDKINSKKVIGVVKIMPSYVRVYLYKNKYILSGNIKVNENGLWLNVSDSFYSKEIIDYKKILYHIVIEDGIIDLEDIQITDYIEIHDEFVNQRINNIVNNNIIKY